MSETVTAFADAEVIGTDVLIRTLNKGLMVQWINADLLNRCANDVRKSTVLYDADGDFVYAVEPGVEIDAALWDRLQAAGVRFWSKGIV